MSQLPGAYGSIAGSLKPQKQGTCGLYSFWFATMLLRAIFPTTRAIPYPRKSTAPPGSGEESMRHYAKGAFDSAQGEVLTAAEMEDIITHFGYRHETHIGKDGRQAFITKSLQDNAPVLFPYMNGPGGPIATIPVGKTGGKDYGSHWSLIFDEDSNDYVYIEPNKPNTPLRRAKAVVLNSNSFVDSYKYDRYWTKGEKSRISPVQNVVFSTLYGFGITLGDKVYDIGPSDRQNLKNVLIAVR